MAYIEKFYTAEQYFADRFDRVGRRLELKAETAEEFSAWKKELRKALWEVALIDLDGSHAGGERVIDWEQDADRIEASLWQAYGMPFEDIRERVSIEQLAALLCALPYETPLGRALYYRTAEEPALTEYNREQVEEFRRLRSLYALDVSDDGRGGDAMERMDAATGDAFAAIAGSARRAG